MSKLYTAAGQLAAVLIGPPRGGANNVFENNPMHSRPVRARGAKHEARLAEQA